MEPLDLLIVGAGPIGLATAVGALHRGVNPKRLLVVDQAQSFRPVGQFINLLPNAMNVLELICPDIIEQLEPFRRRRIPGMVGSTITSGSGKYVGYTDIPEEIGNRETASMLWWQLQKLLLDLLPSNIVVLDHQLVDSKQQGDVVVAEFLPGRRRENVFKNWEGDDMPEADDDDIPAFKYFDDVEVSENGGRRVQCKARVLVGADGINSVARRCIYRDQGIPERFAEAVYTGFARIMSAGNPKLEEEEDKKLRDTHIKNSVIALVTCDQDAVNYESLRWLLVRRPDRMKSPFSWLIMQFAAVEFEKLKSSSAEDIFNIAVEEAKRSGFSNSLLQLEQQLWNDSSGENITRGMYVVPAKEPLPYTTVGTGEVVDFPSDCNRPWYHKRAVLVGDSKHAAPPFLAQGTAMGFEDVHILLTKFGEAGIWEKGTAGVSEEDLIRLFDEYMTERMDRVCMFQKYVINRVSEYDLERKKAIQKALWEYNPKSSKT